MSRSTVLLDFSEEIICSIAEYAGPLAQYELHKTGNRLLFAKLFCSKYYVSYSNISDFGAHTYWSATLVKKMHSLKKFALFSSVPSRELDWSFILALPCAIEQLSIQLPRWQCVFENRSTYFDLQPHFPNLTTLTLDLSVNLEKLPNPRRSKRLQALEGTDHFSFLPKSLTSLSTNIPVTFLPKSVPNLTQLRLGNELLPENAFAMIAELRLLRELDLPALTACSSPKVDEQEEDKVEPHKHLKTLKLDNLSPFRGDNGGLRKILQHFSYLEYLSVPKLLLDTQAYTLAPNLKFLKSGFSQLGSYSYPGYSWNSNKLEEIILVPVDNVKRYESMKALLSRLPPYLLSFSLPSEVMTETEVSLLPRSLTKLELLAIATTISEVFRILPPNLTSLSLMRPDYYRTLTSTDQHLINVPKMIKMIRCSNSILVRTNQIEKSILTTGWTSTIYAAATGDLETMRHLILKEISFNPFYVRDVLKLSILEIPTKTWRWLLAHGHLSNPSETNRIDATWFFTDAGEENSPCDPKTVLFKFCRDDHLNIFKALFDALGSCLKLETASRLVLHAITQENFKVAQFLVVDHRVLIDAEEFIESIMKRSSQCKSQAKIVLKTIKWLCKQAIGFGSFHIKGEIIASPTALFECLMAILRVENLNGSLLKLLRYFVKVVGVDPHSIHPNAALPFYRLSHIVCPTIFFLPNPDWHLKAVRWMFKHNVEIVPTVIEESPTSVSHIAVQTNNGPLISLLVSKGYDFCERVGKTREKLVDLMPPELKSLLKANGYSTNNGKATENVTRECESSNRV